MKSILSDIFNEIISGYNKLLETTVTKLDASKDTARDRLKLVLMHDRSNLSPEVMAKMRDELVEVISRYVEIDKEALDLNLASEGNSIALMASIPVKRGQANDASDDAVAEETQEIQSDIDEALVANPIAKDAKKSNKSKKQEKSETTISE